ncbi:MULTISPECIES: hypothetical protein [Sphingobacterium]|uniref:TonB C-terminal domain-containing protein n=1 Tax=Sphingobacterium kitahiroshimense TaxID=470446 RepID=A0ABV0BZC7_9SPHI|nr:MULTISPECIES: hypothetical protein [unclassified Sphingobacterium]MBB2950913.1 hypothetical protein [Sphingobacterium sp. JUb56]NJI72575.1 hypothetical protein [Sphingobacterium sp. B16(2022)]
MNYIILLFLILFTSFSQICFANKREDFNIDGSHPDTTYIYFNNNGEIITSKKDSYSYQKIVPYGNDSLNLFNITSYYTDTDSLKSNGYSGRLNNPFEFGLKYIGELVSYYPNGNLESLEKFNEYSEPIDSSYYYYPNGKLKMIIVHEEIGKKIFSGTTDTQPFYLLYLDSIGNYLLKRGNGFLRIENAREDYTEGELKNNEKVGKWKGRNMGTFYEELYQDNQLVQGKRFKKNGEVIIYSQENVRSMATYPKGMDVFMKSLYKNLSIPQDLIKDVSSQSISVTFTIDRGGNTNNFRISEKVPLKVREQIVSAIKQMGNWNPGRLQGMEVNMDYTVPIRVK